MLLLKGWKYSQESDLSVVRSFPKTPRLLIALTVLLMWLHMYRSPSSDPHITWSKSSEMLAYIGKFSFLCPFILYIYLPFLMSKNHILESFVVTIAIEMLKKSIPVTFLPLENFPLLFLQLIDIKGLSFS